VATEQHLQSQAQALPVRVVAGVALELAAARREQAVLEAVVTVKQMLELPHKTELRILEVVVEVRELQEARFLVKHQAQVAQA